MKHICVSKFPDAIGYIGPNTQSKTYKLPCGTLLEVIGKVKPGEKTFYVVKSYQSKPLFVLSIDADLVEEF